VAGVVTSLGATLMGWAFCSDVRSRFRRHLLIAAGALFAGSLGTAVGSSWAATSSTAFATTVILLLVAAVLTQVAEDAKRTAGGAAAWPEARRSAAAAGRVIHLPVHRGVARIDDPPDAA
jgi:hypothetical protein